jgi:hypothetical protein
MKEVFFELDEKYIGNITLSDLSQKPIENRDKVLIKLKNGEHKFISVVYYILDIKNYI